LVAYCAPQTTAGCTDSDVIGRVQLNTLDNTTNNNCPSGTLGYHDFRNNPTLTTTLNAGTLTSVRSGQTAGQRITLHGLTSMIMVSLKRARDLVIPQPQLLDQVLMVFWVIRLHSR